VHFTFAKGRTKVRTTNLLPGYSGGRGLDAERLEDCRRAGKAGTSANWY